MSDQTVNGKTLSEVEQMDNLDLLTWLKSTPAAESQAPATEQSAVVDHAAIYAARQPQGRRV